MKKIVFCDIDKTLTNDFIVSKENISKVNEYTRLGGIFVLISGRGIKYVKEFSKQFNDIRYIIGNNGAIIYDLKNDKVIYKKCIDNITYDELCKMQKKYSSNFIINTSNNILVNNFYKQDEINTIISDINDLSYDKNDVIQLVLSNFDKEATIKLIDNVSYLNNIKIVNRHRSLYDASYPSGNNIWIDIICKEADKGLGVTKLLEYLNINLEDSVRIGDDLNDIPMFFDKGINVAVENACDELKKKADIIVSKSINNGVSLALNKIIKEEI